MATTFSPNLGIALIGTGDQAGAWGNTTNTNLGTILEQSISGYVTQAVATGIDTTISIPNGASGTARNMFIELTGTGGTNTNLIVPANKKLYFVYNNTASGQVTVKVSGQTGVSIPNGKKMALVCNGTDVVVATNYMDGNISGSAASVSGTIAVANGGTGQTSFTDGQLLIGNTATGGLSKATLQAGANVSITNGNGTITIAASGGGGGGGGTVTSVDVSGGSTGLTTSGGPVTGSGTITMAGTLGAANGGTGQTSYTQGDLMIGNAAGGLSKNKLTAGSGITVTNGDGTITIASTAGGGSVTSVNASGGTTGLSFSGGPITTSGTLTAAGTLVVANGGTGSTTASGARTALGLAIGSDIPGPTGTGASGTWSISINGNAATVTNGVVTSGSYADPSWITSLAASKLTGTVAVSKGGTGTTTTPTNGQLLIGNGSGYSVANLTAGSNVTITNSAGGITIAATGGGGSGTVTSVGGTGSVNGITLSGTVTTSGNLTLGGTLSGVSLTTQVSGTLPVANGGTGATTLTGYVKGSGTSAFTASSTVPVGDLSGTVGISQGGTGQTTQQAAINALAGATTAGAYLRGTGSNVSMQYIQSGDIPTAFLRYSSSGSAVVTASTAAPTGGSDGDIWLKY